MVLGHLVCVPFQMTYQLTNPTYLSVVYIKLEICGTWGIEYGHKFFYTPRWWFEVCYMWKMLAILFLYKLLLLISHGVAHSFLNAVYLFHLMILQRHCQSLRWLMTTCCLFSMKTQALRFYCKEGSSHFSHHGDFADLWINQDSCLGCTVCVILFIPDSKALKISC